MEKAIKTVGVLFFDDKDRVLLVKHTEKAEHITGVYGVPAGRIEPGETAKEAAVREIKEETKLDIKEDSLVPIPKEYEARMERKNISGGVLFSVQVFVCTNFSGTPRETDETIPEWVYIKDLDNYNLLPNVKNFVEDGLKLITS